MVADASPPREPAHAALLQQWKSEVMAGRVHSRHTNIMLILGFPPIFLFDNMGSMDAMLPFFNYFLFADSI
jgi:hypothetical protein